MVQFKLIPELVLFNRKLYKKDLPVKQAVSDRDIFCGYRGQRPLA